ncbi:MAG: methyltransferase domain-containing protein, partial [Nitrospirae bacterium]
MKAPSIEEVYLNLSSLFPVWVRLIEFKTRLMEAEEASDGNPRILIISPPTDPGIKCIIEANPGGENYLLCFSKSIRQRAIDYLGIETSSYIRLVVSPFFRIPFENNFFDLILANCFFDFCHESKIMEATKEISRVTVLNGKLLSVYMDLPYNFSGKLWGWLFRRFPFLSQGC